MVRSRSPFPHPHPPCVSDEIKRIEFLNLRYQRRHTLSRLNERSSGAARSSSGQSALDVRRRADVTLILFKSKRDEKISITPQLRLLNELLSVMI